MKVLGCVCQLLISYLKERIAFSIRKPLASERFSNNPILIFITFYFINTQEKSVGYRCGINCFDSVG